MQRDVELLQAIDSVTIYLDNTFEALKENRFDLKQIIQKASQNELDDIFFTVKILKEIRLVRKCTRTQRF